MSPTLGLGVEVTGHPGRYYYIIIIIIIIIIILLSCLTHPCFYYEDL